MFFAPLTIAQHTTDFLHYLAGFKVKPLSPGEQVNRTGLSSVLVRKQWSCAANHRVVLDRGERSFYIHPMSRPTIDHSAQILATAEKLIYENGIHATGMDLLVKTSGVSRKAIYNHFATKDDVAAAALSARDVRWMQWFRTECDKAATPYDRILSMFTVLKSWFETEGFRGCAFINTAGEVGDPNDPIRQIAKLHKQKLLDYTLELTEQLNTTQQLALARQLFVLMEGAITTARVMGDYHAAEDAKDVAHMLLKATTP